MNPPAIYALAVDADTGERYEVDGSNPAAHEAFLAWCRFHGLDPNTMPAGQHVVRFASKFQIHYTAWVRDELGGLVAGPSRAPLEIQRIEQGEAPPLPFPTEVMG